MGGCAPVWVVGHAAESAGATREALALPVAGKEVRPGGSEEEGGEVRWEDTKRDPSIIHHHQQQQMQEDVASVCSHKGSNSGSAAPAHGHHQLVKVHLRKAEKKKK